MKKQRNVESISISSYESDGSPEANNKSLIKKQRNVESISITSYESDDPKEANNNNVDHFSEEHNDRVTVTWQDVASAIDCACFVWFLLTSAVPTVVMMPTLALMATADDQAGGGGDAKACGHTTLMYDV